MKVCAVIAEFNPFHNGHAYLLSKIRALGYTHIVVFMSGNFVQRGEPSIFSKDFRAEVALKMGADLVVEIPTIKVLLTAEKYAFSALDLVGKFGNLVDALAFGTETENFENLITIKNALESEKFSDLVKKHLEKGLTFAVSRENALREIIKNREVTDEIKKPNNILAIEYLRAIEKLNLSLKPLPIERMQAKDKYSSASILRKMILKKDSEYKNYIPKGINFPEDMAVSYFDAERQVLCKLRSLDKSFFALLPDISEGLENRVYNSLLRSRSLEELFEMVKTKRYTLSRIKRIILCAFLGITSEMTERKLPYIRILGSDEKGFEILKNLNFPIVTKYSDVLKLGGFAKELFDLENRFTNLYYTFTKEILPCEKEKTFRIIRRI